ncbi:MAG: haloacid dehalogenase, partial [Eggerthellaceae bacterium]|nr:haloacid dehalogenase [Eggerthellaceae bacterium]
MDAQILKNKKLFLLDMDGTLYLDDQIFEGTEDFLRTVKEQGHKYIYLTNNSSKGVESYVAKIKKLGIEASKEEFFTSIEASIIYLQGKGYKKIYVLGTASFKAQLREAGLPITDKLEDNIDLLLMGFDTELTFQKLKDACILLGREIDYLATNPDWV